MRRLNGTVTIKTESQNTFYLVGPTGRVIAFEPMSATFSLLAANIESLPHNNVTLLNAAASDVSAIAGMSLPQFNSGLENYYEARITTQETIYKVMCFPIDGLGLPFLIKLIKI